MANYYNHIHHNIKLLVTSCFANKGKFSPMPSWPSWYTVVCQSQEISLGCPKLDP